jgi:hypothetical protein
MSKLLASTLLVSTLLFAGAPARAEPEAGTRLCPGITVARFEQRFPQPVERFAFEQAMLDPFVELWRAAQRPALPVRPERVTVYALPGKPLVIGYQAGDCVIALLTVERQRFWQWLRPRFGWAV